MAAIDMTPVELQTLRQALEQETELAQRLYEVLAQEQQALEQMASEQIHELAKLKTQLLMQMDEKMAVRQKLMPNANPQNGLESFLEQAPEMVARVLRPVVEQFREWLYRCHRQNEVNGRIIAGSRRSVERSLNLLRGQNPDMVLYNAKGAARPMGAYHRHATA
ncbi:flagella synthesis protein FlgN [Permianibacter aggregans]|uniref:Flagella synthesis protein FlgN n=1 Tax=Permianibacter aggregans TaxID=1510150 RepID=A0A4R6UNC6_9GAMM|nr:flagellar protein FlgN [Permianibacter aggregans]QGX38308.1 flagellar protein FlgN [Permianibacter aggregans]TDQ48628.1 flagella synthesis protein FlgN [Permianibacter aggregans]